MSKQSEMRKFLRAVSSIPGVSLDIRQHVTVLYRGRRVVTLPKTPSDSRWRANAIKHLRQGGVPTQTLRRGSPTRPTRSERYDDAA